MTMLRTSLLTRWRRSRWLRAAVAVLVLAASASLLGGSAASAGVNLVVNPGLETLGSNGFPTCWEQSGYGTEGEQFECAPDCCFQYFFALRAEGHANSDLAAALADGVGSHSEDAGDGEHGAQSAKHT